MEEDEDISSRDPDVNVIAERCKGCGFCIEFCPQKALKKSNVINSHGYYVAFLYDKDKCTGCHTCDMICPEFAISVTQDREEAKRRR